MSCHYCCLMYLLMKFSGKRKREYLKGFILVKKSELWMLLWCMHADDTVQIPENKNMLIW